MTLIIRHAVKEDVSILATIFNHYVLNSYATLRAEPESIEQRMKSFKEASRQGRYQMLVAEEAGKILGTASSFRYREGAVFEKTVEFGIYLDPNTRGKGIGTALYQALLENLSKEDVHLVVAGIALPNPGSVALHKKVGFTEVGVFDEYAHYKNKYYSSLWVQKRLK